MEAALDSRAKPLVLVAEDDVEVASLVAISLRRAGFSVKTTGNGEDALEEATARPPAACVLDIMMPRMDGYQVLRRLKDEPATADIPVLLLSARAGALDRDYGLRLGAAAYVKKPFTPKRLGDAVWALLGPSGMPRL